MPKLISDIPPMYDDYIERVSTYIAQKGDKYKSHYATILTWIRRDGETAASQPNKAIQRNFPFLQLLAKRRREKMRKRGTMNRETPLKIMAIPSQSILPCFLQQKNKTTGKNNGRE